MTKKLRFLRDLNKLLIRYSNRITGMNTDLSQDFITVIIYIKVNDLTYSVTVEFDNNSDTDSVLLDTDQTILKLLKIIE